MDQPPPPVSRQLRASIDAFEHVEHGVYVAIGILLALTAIVGVGGAAASAWEGVADWRSGETIAVIIERLLFVLMVVEILHTVRVSIRSGSLTCEPFLVVGLIASIRRVLVITLESSQATRHEAWTPETEAMFRASMIELGVLASLILVMVLSIYMLQRNSRRPAAGVIAPYTDQSG